MAQDYIIIEYFEFLGVSEVPTPSIVWPIDKQLERCSFVATRRKAFVETIEPSENALSMELGVTSEMGFAV